jgi:hypothetical protein
MFNFESVLLLFYVPAVSKSPTRQSRCYGDGA